MQSLRRNYIFEQARQVFQQHGFLPIETPAMENLETLTGKYGDEGDRLIFKILNSGDYLAKADATALEEKNSGKLVSSIAEKALRYDLTVPFARLVVQHQHELHFPFKRYQIQPVWRADRPQKGRYREFYQCDVDIIGSDSLLNEAELLSMVFEVFEKLGLPDINIRINNRKILSGLAEHAGIPHLFTAMTVALDKLDKIGTEGVKKEMQQSGIGTAQAEKVLGLVNMEGGTDQKLEKLGSILGDSPEAVKGIAECKAILDFLSEEVRGCVSLDLTLARGLNYYTGAIIEVGHEKFPSSICGGGRYDDLTGIFGLKDMSGVGVSFGADRIYDLMEEQGLFPGSLAASSDLIFVNFGPEEVKYCLKLAGNLRKNGISVEVYPESAKMKKQMKYADGKNIRYVALVGSEEMKSGNIAIKNLQSGEQEQVHAENIAAWLKSKLNK